MTDPANVLPGQHAPVPSSRDDLLIEALRTANRMGGLLNEIAAWAHEQADGTWGTDKQQVMEKLEDLLCRRFSDGSAVHLFIAADNLSIDLPPDLNEDPEGNNWSDDE